ncbi:Uncharacterized protein BM_BM18570 [Brugia malayi]|uniref:Uncharacterized protein n=1 Tax=Brugia malayi TaxID=6279 RepID=A0A4E9EU69_BRUMA|nr:Uncharacterized protein BM_BM18570 [Brugia malayi]VIO86344.1 Uncharacterized protein BM_BM18570 [Brugia malayi]
MLYIYTIHFLRNDTGHGTVYRLALRKLIKYGAFKSCSHINLQTYASLQSLAIDAVMWSCRYV